MPSRSPTLQIADCGIGLQTLPASPYDPQTRIEQGALCRLRRDAQWPEFAIGLRYKHSSDGVRSVSLLPERKRQFAKPPLHPIRLDVREVLSIHTGCALVGAALGIGMGQDVLAADLVVQGVEAVADFCLRFRVQRHLQFLNTLRS